MLIDPLARNKQILASDDLEERAFACLTLARCKIAVASDSSESDLSYHILVADLLPETMREILYFLGRAEADYAAIDCLQERLDTLYLCARAHHHMGDVPSRDQAAEKYAALEVERVKIASSRDPLIVDIASLVAEIGAAAAAGR